MEPPDVAPRRLMKILFDHPCPFMLTHGGFQTQIECTKAALEAIGVEVEYLRWYDDSQKGDIIHFFGRPLPYYIETAHQSGIKVVVAELLGGLGARSARQRAIQRWGIRVCEKVLPSSFRARLSWESYVMADACIGLTSWEASLMTSMFGARPDRTFSVPNGVELEFMEPHDGPRGKWLVCVAAITEVKRVLELAEAAVIAGTPVWVLGKPYSETDPYAVRFMKLAREHPEVVRYEGRVNGRRELARVYREARGSVLLSAWETLSLSALESAACGCPLLLSDLPWSRSVFGEKATYCPISGPAETAPVLKRFYDQAPDLPVADKPKTWVEVAEMFKAIYEGMLRR